VLAPRFEFFFAEKPTEQCEMNERHRAAWHLRALYSSTTTRIDAHRPQEFHDPLISMRLSGSALPAGRAGNEWRVG
jgi:hypothetical protein